MTDKRANFNEVVNFISSGCTLALGGMTNYRRPMAFIRSLIKHYQKTGTPDDLTLICFTAGLESEWLVGAGMVSKVRTCYFGLEIFGLAPMFTYYANRGKIKVVEETEASLALGFRNRLFASQSLDRDGPSQAATRCAHNYRSLLG
jgi:glutaconate CoA-transferase subunit A